jgi:hypothetical protein
MPKHIKPTKEELEEGMKKSLEEAEELKEEEPEKPEEPEIPQKEEPSKEVPPEEPTKEEEPEEPKEPPVDYKKKFIESTREAQILHAKNRKVNEVFDKAMKTPEPTEDELRKEYSDWDVMGEFEKKMAKDNMINSRRFATISEIAEENKDLEAWQTKVDTYIEDPKTLVDNPDLEGKEDEFRLFATKPTRRNMDFEDIVSAFLYDATKKVKPMKKGKMFETGTGGPNEHIRPKADKLSIEEAGKLRKTDYNKFAKYLREGKIDSTNV